MALCDRALVLEPDPETLLVRLRAAEAAGQPRAVVETLQALTEYAGERANALPGGLGQRVVSSLRDWKPRLRTLEQPFPEAERRRDAIAEMLDVLVPDVEVPKAPGSGSRSGVPLTTRLPQVAPPGAESRPGSQRRGSLDPRGPR